MSNLTIFEKIQKILEKTIDIVSPISSKLENESIHAESLIREIPSSDDLLRELLNNCWV